MKIISNINKTKLVSDYWSNIEDKKSKPKYIRSGKDLNSIELKKAIEEFNIKMFKKSMSKNVFMKY